MQATWKVAVLAGIAGLSLAGCAETRLVSHAAKEAAQALPDTELETGTYKVGRPYQVNGVWYYPKEDPYYREVGLASWYGEPFHGRRTANGERYDMNRLTAAHRTLPLPSKVRVTNLDNGRSLVLRVNDRGPFVDDRIIDVSRRAAQLLGFENEGLAEIEVVLVDAPSAPTAPVLARAERPAAVADSKPVAATPIAAEETAPPPLRLIGTAAAAELPPQASRPTKIATRRAEAPVNARDAFFIQVGAFAFRDNAETLAESLSSIGGVIIRPVEVDGATLYRVRIGPLADLADAEAVLQAVVDSGQRDARLIAGQR